MLGSVRAVIVDVPPACLVAVLVFALSMGIAALSDLLTLRIPNALNYGLAVGFFPFAAVAGVPLAIVGWHVAVAVVFLACAVVLFARGFIGGGDAKMGAACALWLGSGAVVPFVAYFALAGGVLGLAFLALRILPKPAALAGIPWADRLWSKRAGIPYGIAIAVGALIALPHSTWFHPFPV